MSGTPTIYCPSSQNADRCLRQTEILSNLVQFSLVTESIGKDPEIDFITHPFAVLITQDCDLEQDFVVRQQSKENNKLLPRLLFCEAVSAEELFFRVAENKKDWRRLNIPNNKNERFHFLQQVDKESDAEKAGLPEIGIDFKRCFTMPTEEVYRRIEIGEAKRRCYLNSPYKEHLSKRFAYFLSRIALPSDHESED